jgi:hypothetical protein
MDPLEDARLLVSRANEQIGEFNTLLTTFFKNEAWFVRIDFDSKTGAHIHKLIVSGQLGSRIKIIGRDVWGNLRAALDHLNAACARLGGAVGHDSGAHFPFARNHADLRPKMRQRCRNVPEAVQDYFRSLRPYPGGDDRLYALASIRNSNEHWKLRAALYALHAVQITWPNGDWKQKIIQVSGQPGAVHEIELFASDSPIQNYYLEMAGYVGLEDFEAFGAGSAESAFEIQARKVTEIIDETERILRRIGLLSNSVTC